MFRNQIPEKYLDGVTGKLMDDPVAANVNGALMIVNYSTIKELGYTGNIIANEKLKNEISEWKKNNKNIIVSDDNKMPTLKIALVGDSGVGKSSIINRYLRNEFKHKYKGYNATESDYINKRIGKYNGLININDIYWDSRKLSNINHDVYLKNSDIIIYCFDVNWAKTFENIDGYLAECNEYAPNHTKVLVATKIDLEHQRVVSQKRASTYATKHEMIYIETSSKENLKIEDIFNQAVEKYFEAYLENKREEEKIISNNISKEDIISRPKNFRKIEKMSDDEVQQAKSQLLKLCDFVIVCNKIETKKNFELLSMFKSNSNNNSNKVLLNDYVVNLKSVLETNESKTNKLELFLNKDFIENEINKLSNLIKTLPDKDDSDKKAIQLMQDALEATQIKLGLENNKPSLMNNKSTAL